MNRKQKQNIENIIKQIKRIKPSTMKWYQISSFEEWEYIREFGKRMKYSCQYNIDLYFTRGGGVSGSRVITKEFIKTRRGIYYVRVFRNGTNRGFSQILFSKIRKENDNWNTYFFSDELCDTQLLSIIHSYL